MRKVMFLSALAITVLLALVYAAPANAQATRTWVSGVGDDVNPCSRTAPCKTWAGAISKTAPGGEIDALDPGGFGGLTITKSITLDGGGGQVASTLVAGVNGIVVAAAANDVVVIKNIRFQGLLGNGGNPGNSGQTGIKFNSGKTLVIEKCEIYGFAVAGIGITPNASGAGGSVTVSNTQLYNNQVGILMDSAGGSVNAVVSNTAIAENRGNGITVQSNGTHAGMVVDNSVISLNGGIGLQTNGAQSIAIIGRNLVNGNGTGLQTSGVNGTGQIQTWVNNEVAGNSADIVGTLSPVTGGLK